MKPVLRLGVMMMMLAMAAPTPAYAVACGCARKIGLCQAEAFVEGDKLVFGAFTQECAEIAYTIDGESGVIAFRGGREAIEYLTPGGIAQSTVAVTGCAVCDATGSRAARRGYATDR